MDTKERNRRPAGNRKAPAGANRRRPARSRNPKAAEQKRMVRPPREEIPEVVYSNPKPFHRGKFLLKLVTVGAVVLAVFLCMSLFFRVDTIMVAGAETYSAWQIREASGIEEGTGLLSLSRGGVAGRIKSNLPYVDEVKVSISLPGTVYIEITELDVAYAIADEADGWWLISAEGRVIEAVAAADALDYTQVAGVRIAVPTLDAAVQAASQPEGEADGQNAQRLQIALSILGYLEDNGIIGQVASVDVSNLNSLTMNYEDRLAIVLGDTEQLRYKIAYMASAVEQLESYQTGQLDVSFRYSDQALSTQEEE